MSVYMKYDSVYIHRNLKIRDVQSDTSKTHIFTDL